MTLIEKYQKRIAVLEKELHDSDPNNNLFIQQVVLSTYKEFLIDLEKEQQEKVYKLNLYEE